MSNAGGRSASSAKNVPLDWRTDIFLRSLSTPVPVPTDALRPQIAETERFLPRVGVDEERQEIAPRQHAHIPRELERAIVHGQDDELGRPPAQGRAARDGRRTRHRTLGRERGRRVEPQLRIDLAEDGLDTVLRALADDLAAPDACLAWYC